jgi:hypothetical protein
VNGARVLAFVAAALASGLCAHPFAVRVRAMLVNGDAALQAGPAPLAALRASLPNAAPPLRVLFVGNSLSQRNALPAMVAQLAAAAGEERPLDGVLEALPGQGILEHLQRGHVQRLFTSEHYDYVVLQDQGQRPGVPQWREKEMFAPIRTLHAAIGATGARTLLFETFARREGDFSNFPGDTYEAMQTRIDDGYEQIGRELGIPVVPVGRIWRETLRTQPELELWANDGLHPSRAGTYLVACAMLQRLYGRSPLDNPYLAGLPPEQATAIQNSVALQMLARPPAR